MMQKTRTGRVLAATLALLVVLALPAFAEQEGGSQHHPADHHERTAGESQHRGLRLLYLFAG